MKLKNIIPVLLMTMCISLVMPAFAGNETPVATEKTNNDAHAQQLVARLKEIREMDKSNLTSSERKALRREVKEMKKEVKRDGSKGIYLSVGAIIIIVLLLILLL